MQHLDLQQICVFQNDKHSFVHIGVFNMYDKLGRPNYGSQLHHHIRNALRIKEIAPLPGRPSADVSFGNAFNIRLMNTNGEGWREVRRVENLSVFEAWQIAHDIAEQYIAAGYTFTGSLGGKAIRHFGVKGITNIVIKNANQRRLYAIAEKLVEGITGIKVQLVQRDIYAQYVYHGLDTRRKFWNYIHANMHRYFD